MQPPNENSPSASESQPSRQEARSDPDSQLTGAPSWRQAWSGPWRDRAARAALFVVCILLSAEALATASRWHANRDRLSKILSESGTDAPISLSEAVRSDSAEGDDDLGAAIRRVAFERTPHHAKLTVARTLVYQAMADSAAGTRAGGAETASHLAVAREMALEVLGQQPNSWQALMFVGAATYLEWSLTSDRRLYTSAAEWEQPLLEALEQARGQPEPRRFLTAAYLETWAALSAAKKARARELARAMFREDPDSFDRLGPVWLEVAGDLEDSLEAIPDLPGPWHALQRHFAQTRDWDSFCMAHGRHIDALRRKLTEDLEEAEQRLRLGDLAGGRQVCLSVVFNSPRDGTFADLVSRALELYPPGLQGRSTKDTLSEWLRWALELNAFGIDPFNPRVIRRLTDSIGELDAPSGALAALIAGDTYHVNRYKKLADYAQRKEWAPFLIAETRWLIERQTREDLEAAARALGDVHRSAESSATYWLARRQLARANGDFSDLATADRRLAAFRSDRWQAGDWRWRGRRVTLELHPEGPGTGLAVTIARAPAGGAVAELAWDGSSIAIQPVASQQTIRLDLDVEPRPHVLELRALAGGEIEPGSVRLLRPPRRGDSQ